MTGALCCARIQVIVSAGSLLTLYLGIEIMSLSLYAMVAFDRDDGVAAEAAMKYFVLGRRLGVRSLRHRDPVRRPGTFLLGRYAAAVGVGDAARSACCSASHSSSLAFAFKFGAVPFTCGCPTSITDADARTLFVGSDAEGSRRLRWRCGCSRKGSAERSMPGRHAVLLPCSDDRRQTSSRSRRRTTSECWRIRRSRMSAVILLGVLAGNAAGYRAAMFYTLTT